MASELKPCPFCGSRAAIFNRPLSGFYPYCTNEECEAEGVGKTSEAEAIAAWNRRALDAAAQAHPSPVQREPSEGEVAQDILPNLRSANLARQAAWCPDQVPDLSFRGNELAGETGEVCNVIKKLERERLGWRGSRDTKEHLAEELADVVICADLCALSAGIDLNEAVVAKFNATSEKVGLPQRLAAPPAPATRQEVIEAANALRWALGKLGPNEDYRAEYDRAIAALRALGGGK